MTSATSVDSTAAVLAEVALLPTWFAPPAGLRVESLAVACALAGACYALPAYARESTGSGEPRWWPFINGYQRTEHRRGELLAAIGFLLAAHRTEPSSDERGAADRLATIERLRRNLAGPYRGDPGCSTRTSAVDALALAAVCYALPTFARQLGTGSVPLLWPWPARLWAPSTRGQDLLTAAAMLVAELERHTTSPAFGRPALTVVPGGAP